MNNSSIFDQIEISQKNDPIIISEKISISGQKILIVVHTEF